MPTNNQESDGLAVLEPEQRELIDYQLAPEILDQPAVPEPPRRTPNQPIRLTDNLSPASMSEEQIRELVQFEDMLIHFAEEARKNGQPVGLDYFMQYKPKFSEKAIGIAGSVGMAFLIPIVKRVTDKLGGDPVYKPDGETGGDVMKLTTMDKNILLTQEEKDEIKLKGKSANDPRIIQPLGGLLRKTSLDELPQVASVGTLTNVIGPHNLRRMITRAEEDGLSVAHPETHAIYKEAVEKGVKKGIAGGYLVAARGGTPEAQYVADGILMAHMSAAAAPWIIQQSVKTVLSGK
jgi:lipopolysaccharide/colanic/teichoic acid biosynthesis glycosyltransferase